MAHRPDPDELKILRELHSELQSCTERIEEIEQIMRNMTGCDCFNLFAKPCEMDEHDAFREG